MKLLLDENLPKRLKIDFPEHNIYTVTEMNWNGMKNGVLMREMISQSFDVLITFDKNLQYQQNFSKYQLPVIVLDAVDNTYITLKSLVPSIKKILNLPLKAGPIIIK
jgi:predicted nuclease of predicted toxin-antitoxin system